MHSCACVAAAGVFYPSNSLLATASHQKCTLTHTCTAHTHPSTSVSYYVNQQSRKIGGQLLNGTYSIRDSIYLSIREYGDAMRWWYWWCKQNRRITSLTVWPLWRVTTSILILIFHFVKHLHRRRPRYACSCVFAFFFLVYALLVGSFFSKGTYTTSFSHSMTIFVSHISQVASAHLFSLAAAVLFATKCCL